MLGLRASRGLHRRLAGLSLICHEELVYALRLFLPCQKTGQQLGTISLTVSEAGKQRLISHSLSVRGDRQAQDLQWGLSNPAEKSHRAKLTHRGKSQNKSSACFALIFEKTLSEFKYVAYDVKRKCLSPHHPSRYFQIDQLIPIFYIIKILVWEEFCSVLSEVGIT